MAWLGRGEGHDVRSAGFGVRTAGPIVDGWGRGAGLGRCGVRILFIEV